MKRRGGLAVWVGVFGFFLSSLIAVRVLSNSDWDPTIFTAFGEEAAPTREYAEARLGEVFLRPKQGHDGKFFFVQANDPWVTDPAENALVLDRPLYRSQRMLYPALAGLGGLLSSEGIVWGMIVVNLLAMGFGTWATAVLAREMGGSPWLGIAFVLNLGFVSEMTIDGAGIVSAALAIAGLVLIMRERFTLSAVLLGLAALSREAMLIAAAGAAFWVWRHGRRREALILAIVPVGAVAGWAFYLRLRIGLEAGVDQVQELGIPFQGFVEAFSNWLSDPLDLTVGVAMLVLMAAFTIRAVKSPRLVGWAFLGFVPLGVLFTKQVWNSWFDISRAIAPVITAYALLLLIGSRQPNEMR